MEKFMANIKKKYKVPVWKHKLVAWKLVEVRQKREKHKPQREQGGRVVVCSDLFKVPDERERPDRKILIEGCTGIGKTTLCVSYCRDWASGELLQQFNLVLFLPLHDRGVRSATSILDLLRIVYSDETEEVCTSVASYMDQHEGKDVLVIADGWNELDECERYCKKAFLNHLLFGTKYPFLSVMLTSRLSASDQLHRLPCIDKIIEMRSFDKDNIRENIQLDFCNEQEKAGQLLKQLESNPLIEVVCRTPINYTILCHLCHTLKEVTLPTTMTDLYSKIIMKPGVFNFGTIPGGLQQSSWLLCEFVFKAIENNQTAFSHQDLASILTLNTAALQQMTSLELSMIQSNESISNTDSLHFISLTIQEYLASLHLVRQAQAPDMLLHLIKQHAKSENFDIVWRFFFGIYCKYYHEHTYIIKQAARLLCLIQSKHQKFLQLCHCAFEARNAMVTNEVLKALKSTNSPHSEIFTHFGDPSTAYDCAAIIYVISNIEEYSLAEINLKNCLMESQLEELENALTHKIGMVCVKALDLSNNRLSDQGVSTLFRRASISFESLEKLYLRCNQIEREAVFTIMLVLKHASSHSLKQLDLSFNPLPMPALTELQDAVYSGTLENLEILFLQKSLTEHAEVNLQFLNHFIRGLTSNCKFLRRLNLSANDLGEPGNPIIKEVISELTGLRKDFDLCLNQEYMSEVDNTFIAIMEESIRQKGSINHTIAHGVFVGPGRSGKNSLMNRLMGEDPLDPDSISPSTGVLENVIKVEVKKLCTVATAANSHSLMWKRLDYDEEAVELMMTTTKSHFQIVSSQISEDEKKEAATTAIIIEDSTANTVQTSDNVKKLRLNYSSKGSDVQISGQESSESIGTSAVLLNSSNICSTHLAPLDIFKLALKARQMDALREHLESSWSLYLTNTGGQMEFQELLPLLVCGPSVFFIVFPLNKSLKEDYTVQYQYADGNKTVYQSSCTLMDEIQQTLATIATMDYTGPQHNVNVRPRIFFVGTYKDQLPPSTADKIIQEMDEQLREVVKGTSLYQQGSIEFAKPTKQLIFTVSNLANDDGDFQKIRLALQRSVERSNEFTVECPSSWLVFSLVLRSKHKSNQVLSYNGCFKIAQECGISNQTEFNSALSFIHARLGLIRYFGIKELNTIVVTDPQILFDTITKLMVETFINDYAEANEIEEFQRRGVFSMRAIERICKSGKFKSDLILFPWLLNLLNHLRIAAFFFNAKGEKKCFFPSVLYHAPKQEPTSQFSDCSVPPILVAFESGFCPRGISGALIKYLMTNEMKSKILWGIHLSKIFRNQVSFSVGVNDIILKIRPTHLEVYVDPKSGVSDNDRVVVTCREAYKQIQQAMKGITKGYTECGYYFAFYCTRSECKINQHPAEIDLKNKILKCKITGGQSYLPSLYEIWIAEKVVTNKQNLESNIDEIHLGQIADSMYEWEGSVAECLSLTTVDVAAVKSEHCHKLRLQTRAALTLWKQNLGSRATYNELIYVFENAGYQNYADAVRETAKQVCCDSEVTQSDDSNANDIFVETSLIMPQPPIFPANEACSSSVLYLPPTTNAVLTEEDSSDLEYIHVRNEQKYVDKSLTESSGAGATTMDQCGLDDLSKLQHVYEVNVQHIPRTESIAIPQNCNESHLACKNISSHLTTQCTLDPVTHVQMQFNYEVQKEEHLKRFDIQPVESSMSGSRQCEQSQQYMLGVTRRKVEVLADRETCHDKEIKESVSSDVMELLDNSYYDPPPDLHFIPPLEFEILTEEKCRLQSKLHNIHLHIPKEHWNLAKDKKIEVHMCTTMDLNDYRILEKFVIVSPICFISCKHKEREVTIHLKLPHAAMLQIPEYRSKICILSTISTSSLKSPGASLLTQTNRTFLPLEVNGLEFESSNINFLFKLCHPAILLAVAISCTPERVPRSVPVPLNCQLYVLYKIHDETKNPLRWLYKKIFTGGESQGQTSVHMYIYIVLNLKTIEAVIQEIAREKGQEVVHEAFILDSANIQVSATLKDPESQKLMASNIGQFGYHQITLSTATYYYGQKACASNKTAGSYSDNIFHPLHWRFNIHPLKNASIRRCRITVGNSNRLASVNILIPPTLPIANGSASKDSSSTETRGTAVDCRPHSAEITVQNSYLSYHLVRRSLCRAHVHINGYIRIQPCISSSQIYTAIGDKRFQMAVRTLETANDLFMDRYKESVMNLVLTLDISDGQLHSEFVKAAGQVIDEIRWGRIASLFFLTTLIAERLIHEGQGMKVESLVMWLVQFLNTHVSSWVEQRGGWSAIADALSPEAVAPKPTKNLPKTRGTAVDCRPHSAEITVQNSYLSYHLVRRSLRRAHVHINGYIRIQPCISSSQIYTAIGDKRFQMAVRTLETANDLFMDRYKDSVTNLVLTLDISDGQLHSEFVKAAGQVIDEIRWGRIASLFFLTTLIAERLIHEGQGMKVESLVMWLVQFLNTHVSSWVEQRGGWSAIADALSPEALSPEAEAPKPTKKFSWFTLAAIGIGALLVGSLAMK